MAPLHAVLRTTIFKAPPDYKLRTGPPSMASMSTVNNTKAI